MTDVPPDAEPVPGSFEELVAFYGPPVANTRRLGPVWVIDGQMVGARDMLSPEEYACGC